MLLTKVSSFFVSHLLWTKGQNNVIFGSKPQLSLLFQWGLQKGNENHSATLVTLLPAPFSGAAEGRTPDLDKSSASWHWNVYFTHHFIPKDLKPWTAIATVVTVNILPSVMSSRSDAGSAVSPGRKEGADLPIVTRTAAMAAARRTGRVAVVAGLVREAAGRAWC